MRKLASLFMCIIMILCFAACSGDAAVNTQSAAPMTDNAIIETVVSTKTSSDETSDDDTAAAVTAAEAPSTTAAKLFPEGGNALIVYFSWSGNTTEMAETIAGKTGGELFELVPVNPYPEEYTPCTEVALEERDSNARPEIKDLPDTLDGYDTILIGYPIWWHTAPMIIGTFLENYDLTGIDVYPFTQSASMDKEQFENSMEFVRSCAGSGNVHDGLFVRADDEAAIEEYLKNNGQLLEDRS